MLEGPFFKAVYSLNTGDVYLNGKEDVGRMNLRTTLAVRLIFCYNENEFTYGAFGTSENNEMFFAILMCFKLYRFRGLRASVSAGNPICCYG